MFAIARQARVGLEVQATAAGITIVRARCHEHLDRLTNRSRSPGGTGHVSVALSSLPDKWLLDHVDDEALQCVVSLVVEVHAVARDVIRAERVEE